MLRKLLLATALSIPFIAIAGCGESDEPTTGDALDPDAPDLNAGADFVALPRTVSREDAGARRAKLRAANVPMERTRIAADRDFYVGIRKSGLEDRWFLSAFLSQYFPGAVNGGAATSLGTRVVSFKIQNGKLFVFNADDRHTTSSVFDPELIIEAYPIVDNSYTRSLPGSSNYVFFDPSAGLGRFDFVRDAFGSSYSQVKFTTELTFNQNFKQLSDGATFEQVFTGSADVPISDGQIEPDVFRAGGTLGISLRRYKEGAGYHEVDMPWQEHYFRSDPKLVPNSTEIRSTAAHWDIHPGMQPIQWVIAPELKQLDDSPAYGDVDLVGAVKKGILAWNDVFGFQAFKVRVANPGETFSQDDENYIIFDPDPSLGYAFANWRTNPNTGEIRGASVYFGAGWVDRTGFVDDPPAGGAPGANHPATPPAKLTHGAVPTLAWGGVSSRPLCVQWSDEARSGLRPGGGNTHLTGAQKLEAYVSNMIVHEIGHDLGLRHNFKGTLVPPYSSSVMDYTNFETRVAMAEHPGTYDRAAVRYLYGLDASLPADPFCTDDMLGLDPECQVFDTGADPFATTNQPDYEFIRDYFTRYGLPEEYLPYLGYYAQGIYDFANNGDYAQAQRGWNLLKADVGAPLDPALASDPTFYTSGADLVLRANLEALVATPNPVLIDEVEDQAGAVLANVDGIRGYTSRRHMVDLLKARQNLRSYGYLVAARDGLATQLAGGGLSPEDRLQSRDLLARIDAAIAPYFE